MLIVHLRIRHALRSGVSVRPEINKNTQKGVFVYFGWGALNSLGIKCLRGIPDDLIALCLSNLLIVEPATVVADYEPWPLPILKRPKRGV